MSSVATRGKTEWKVRIASLASFAGTLAVALLLDPRAPEWLDRLPEPLRVIGGAAIVAAGVWASGRTARTRPDMISESTVRAVEERFGIGIPRQGR